MLLIVNITHVCGLSYGNFIESSDFIYKNVVLVYFLLSDMQSYINYGHIISDYKILIRAYLSLNSYNEDRINEVVRSRISSQ